MDKDKVFSCRPHTRFEVCSSGRNPGPEPYLYLLCRQGGKRTGWRNIWEGSLFWVPRGVVSISDGMSFQNHQELQHKQRATRHHLEKGLQSSKERKTAQHSIHNPQLKFRCSWKVTCLRLTIRWSKLLLHGIFHWKTVPGLYTYEDNTSC